MQFSNDLQPFDRKNISPRNYEFSRILGRFCNQNGLCMNACWIFGKFLAWRKLRKVASFHLRPHLPRSVHFPRRSLKQTRFSRLCFILGRSIWNIKYWLWTSKFDAGRQFDGFWRPTSIFDVLSQIFDVQHQFLTSYVKSGINIWRPTSNIWRPTSNIWCSASNIDAGHQILTPDLT